MVTLALFYQTQATTHLLFFCKRGGVPIIESVISHFIFCSHFALLRGTRLNYSDLEIRDVAFSRFPCPFAPVLSLSLSRDRRLFSRTDLLSSEHFECELGSAIQLLEFQEDSPRYHLKYRTASSSVLDFRVTEAVIISPWCSEGRCVAGPILYMVARTIFQNADSHSTRRAVTLAPVQH